MPLLRGGDRDSLQPLSTTHSTTRHHLLLHARGVRERSGDDAELAVASVQQLFSASDLLSEDLLHLGYRASTPHVSNAKLLRVIMCTSSPPDPFLTRSTKMISGASSRNFAPNIWGGALATSRPSDLALFPKVCHSSVHANSGAPWETALGQPHSRTCRHCGPNGNAQSCGVRIQFSLDVSPSLSFRAVAGTQFAWCDLDYEHQVCFRSMGQRWRDGKMRI